MQLDTILSAICENEERIYIEGLRESAQDLFISRLRFALKQNFLVIVPTQPEVEQTVSNLDFFLGQDYQVFPYPTREILPYEELSPDPEVTSQRLRCLQSLLYKNSIIVVASIRACMDKLMPKASLGQCTGYYGVSETINRDEFISDLMQWGYQRSNLVYERGEFSVRGAIIDLFLPDWDLGCRIEFFGDEIISIREFDPTNQRSLREKKEVVILPVKETALNKEGLNRFTKKLEENFGSSVLYEKSLQGLMERLEHQTYFPGIEFYLPYFYNHLDTLWEYLSNKGLVIIKDIDKIMSHAKEYEEEIYDRYNKIKQKNIPYPSPEENFFLIPQLELLLIKNQQLVFSQYQIDNKDQNKFKRFSYKQGTISGIVLKEKIFSKREGFFGQLTQKLKSWQKENYRINLICLTKSQAMRLFKILDEFEVGSKIIEKFSIMDIETITNSPTPITICTGDLSNGLILDFMKLIILPEGEIFGHKHRMPSIKFKRASEKILSDFNELKINDYIVHTEHGIGRYMGLVKLNIGDVASDFMVLEYKGGDKLYVPPENVELIQKYSGSQGAAPALNKLGGLSWIKTKTKVKKAIENIAQDLLDLYAKRVISDGIKFPKDDNWQREFDASFEFEETRDQLKAIFDVKKDMESGRSMDRLICGDVGYGKTEVAMRAVFKSVMSNYQVAIVAPTTVLVQQHLQVFSKRFASYPVRIEMLSRFVKSKKQREIINDIKSGKVDIVIGTHRLLQKDIGFHNLGLLIIDEEHRFGVKHKERLKQLKIQVDVLTLTATPIPRTLYMSTVGVRDMSLIETPPSDRLPITTYITRFDPEIIIQGVQRELDRGGQIFFVHNHIESIASIATYIKHLLPHASICIGHGRMTASELEKIMYNFVNRKFDILVCTTIIESGLDITSTNTIFINRADCFGLAQLYQLRGRVGRGSHRAYAYLLIPSINSITPEAKKRLAAIEELSELGSGFRLAAKDLEIRGAGNLLGKKQHGHISEIGFELYCDLIKEVMAKLKGETSPGMQKIEIKLNLESYFPEEYLRDINQRLNLYKRLSVIEDINTLQEMKDEMKDMYGPMPEAAIGLIHVIELKILGRHLGIKKLTRSGNLIQCEFYDNNFTLDDDFFNRVIRLCEDHKRELALKPNNTLCLILEQDFNKLEIFEKIKWLFNELKND